MAAGSWVFFNSFKELLADGTIDMDDSNAGAFKALLLTSSYTPDVTDVTVSDLTPGTYEVTGSGYARQSLTFTSTTNQGWNRTAGTATWDCDDISFAASGGSIVAKYLVLFYDQGAATDADRELICYVDMDTGGGSVTTNDGNTYVLQISSNGVFTLS